MKKNPPAGSNLATEFVKLLEGTALKKAEWERRVHELERQFGGEVYRSLFFTLSNIDFPIPEAESHWRGLLEEWDELLEAIGGPVDIRVAVLHYFLEIDRKLNNPTIVELRILREAQDSAILDALTGAYNYRYFCDRIEHEVKRQDRTGLGFSLLMIDIDNFKDFNDGNGHLQGNIALQQLAELMLNSVRDTDVVTRYGGEEFAIILCETKKSGALIVARNLRQLVQQTAFQGEETQPNGSLTVSIGVATVPIDTNESQDLITKADGALYEAKSKGKNQIAAYSDERREFVRFDAKLIGRLRTMAAEGSHILIANISRGGLLFQSESLCQVGEVVEFQLTVPPEDHSIQCTARVVRVIEGHEDYEVGVKLIHVEGIHRHRFQKYLASLRTE